jgi:Dolichyl-phosphate-mannose-protein mannosyltransferase
MTPTRTDSTTSKAVSVPGKPFAVSWFWPLVGVLLLIQAGLAVDCARQWTPTHDEFWHLPIGLRMWSSGKLDDDVINPPPVRLWAAIPLVFGGAQPGDAGAKPDVGDIGDAFWAANPNVRFWFWCGRMMIVPLATLIGVVLAVWGRAWYGESAALLSLLLYCTCPTVMANASIVTHDLPLAAAWVVTLFALVRFAEQPSWRRALVFGAVVGIAQLTKLTALVLAPSCVAVWFVLRAGIARRDSAKRTATFWLGAVLASLVVINASYLFQGTGTRLKSLPLVSTQLKSLQKSLSVLGEAPVPLPRNYIAALDRLAVDLERKHPVYLDGEWRDRPFGLYYAAALSYKLPLSTLVLVAAAILAWACPRPASLDRRRGLCLLMAAAILPVLASGSANQIGIRYILPTLPLLHLFAGQATRWTEDSRRVQKWIVWIAALAAPLALRFHPHQMSYFNEFAGGPAYGGLHLVDSNIDWGQDLHGLKAFLDERQVGEIGLAYFGTVVPGRIGITASPPPSRFPRPGWYAISVNFVHGRPHAIRDQHGERTQVGIGEFGYFRFFEPVARIGYSINVYHLTDRDVARYNHALRQLNP